MKLVVQRVRHAQVTVDNDVVGKIGHGYLVLVGIGDTDTEHDADTIAAKLINLRVMADEHDKMNLSVADVTGELLVVSQFTLYADTTQRRPSFTKAAKPEVAEPLFNYFVAKLKESGLKVETGVFGAMMDIELVNSGPVTILLEN
jgi:D-tyrosyl-tRNA(Tyr) deacylase